jgi:periplasmic divalent cation tolerance protein
MNMTRTCLVLTNLPDAASAASLARELVERQLAACVNILAPCTSVYRWQGRVETVLETPLLIKTSDPALNKVQQFIRDHHPYELPEIVVLDIDNGLPEYLSWIARETSA